MFGANPRASAFARSASTRPWSRPINIRRHGVGAGVRQQAERVEQIAVPLVRDEVGAHCQNQGIGGNAEFATRRAAPLRGDRRRHLDAVGDQAHLAGVAALAGQFPDHGVRIADQRRGEPMQPAFEPPQQRMLNW